MATGSRTAVKRKTATTKKKAKKATVKAKKAAAKELSAFDPTAHELVPKHEKLSAKEAQAVRERYHATLHELPKISVHDPAISGLGLSQGDIIRITRASETAGETVFYRGVIDE